MKFKLLFGILIIISCSKESFDNFSFNNKSFNGELKFIKKFGGSSDDKASDIIETSDGNIAIIGSSSSLDGSIIDKNTNEFDFWFLKISQDGEVLLNKTYGGNGDDRGQSIIEMSDGGFLLVGYSKSSDGDATKNMGFHDNWIIRINSEGIILWEKSIGYSGHDHANSIIKTKGGGFFITGFLDVTASNGKGNYGKGINYRHGVGEFWGHKLNSDGEIIWSRFFGGTNNDRSYDVVETNNEEFIIVGSTESNDIDISNNFGSYDYWVIKVDSQGDLLWERTYGGSGIDVAKSISVLPNKNFLILGNSFSDDFQITNSRGESDFWLIEIDTHGNLIKENSCGGSLFDSGQDIVEGPSGSYFLTGFSQSRDGNLTNNKGNNDIAILHITSFKAIINSLNIGGSKIDIANSSVFNRSGSLFVVGSSNSSDGDFTFSFGGSDLFVAKYD